MAGGRPPLREAMRYSEIGFTLVAPTVAGGGIGYWLDGRLGTSPWLLLAGLVVGMAAGFVNFFMLVLPARRDRDGGQGM